jgi:hypothetical protein
MTVTMTNSVTDQDLSNLEVCPSCGEFAKLLEMTGWCRECSPTPTQIRNRLESYLCLNANELEHYMCTGLSLSKAIDKLHAAAQSNRPTCIVCGGVILRARRTAIFCRQHTECRKYARRYTYLYQNTIRTKAQALAQVFEELS